MTKATSKIFVIFFFGMLLSMWLPISSAWCEDDMTSTVAQNPWEFMQEHAGSSYGQFVSDYGNKDDWKSPNIVQCGTEICNLSVSKCMYKSNLDFVNSVVNSIFQKDNQSITVKVNYRCVTPEDATALASQGWKELEKGADGSIKKINTTKDKGTSTKSYEFDKNCYETTDSSGKEKKYCAKVIGNKIEIRSGKTFAFGCEVIAVSLYNNEKCRFCSLIGVIFKTADTMVSISRNTFASGFAILIAVGMALWIAMKTLVFVSSMTSQDAAKYITEMLKQSYKFAIAFMLLLYYDDVFNFIINPLLNAGLAFGTQFAGSGSLTERFGIENISIASFESLGEDLPLDYKRNLDNGYYNIFTYAELENLAYNINKQYTLLQAIGSGLNCLGWKYILLMITNEGWQIGLGFACVIYGLFFSVFGFLLCLAFIFYILDAVVQLGIVGALLPFLIASWPFKITSKYTSTGFKMFLNSIFTFMLIGLVVRIGIGLVSKAVELNVEIESAIEDGQRVSRGGLYELVQAIDNVDTEKLKIMVNVLSVGFLVFLFANILGFLLLARVSELVNRFSSGGMKAIAPSLATMGASTIKGMAKKVSSPTRQAVSDWAEDKAEKGVRKAINYATMRPVRKWLYNKIDNAISNKSNSGGTAAGNKAAAQNSANRAVVGKAQNTAEPQTQKAVLGRGGQGVARQQQNQATLGRKSPSTPNQAGGEIRQTSDDREDSLTRLEKKLTELSQPREGEDAFSRQIRENLKTEVEAHLNWRAKDKTNKPSDPRIDRKKLDEMD